MEKERVEVVSRLGWTTRLKWWWELNVPVDWNIGLRVCG